MSTESTTIANGGRLSARFGQWAQSRNLKSDPNYFIDNPAEVATSRWGFLAAAWYWTVVRNMNSHADARDILGATKAVDGGTNGLADRTARWNHCLPSATRYCRPAEARPNPQPTTPPSRYWRTEP